MRGSVRRGSLRRRVTIAFAVGGLLLAVFVAVATYSLAERYLMQQREQSAERQARLDARVAGDLLRAADADPTVVLEALGLPTSSKVVVRFADDWVATSVAVGPDQLPAELRGLVADGTAARQRVSVLGDPHILVGVPLADGAGEYYEVSSLAELDRTLGVIRDSLVVAAAFATIAAALVGYWGSGRLLEPVSDVATAAQRVTEGDLSARLELPDDRDLASVAISFNRMVDALERRIERDERFVASVSHELRSPLTTLAAAAELLDARRDALPERSLVALDLLLEEVRRFQGMVEDLLELSRTDSGAPSASEAVPVGELVSYSARRALVPDGIVSIDALVEHRTVVGDKRRLERVLVNLIQNADVHGGGVTAVEALGANGSVHIAVEDRGPGVEPDERGRIFERFVRGRTASTRASGSGAGLGLALVTELVRSHQGRVWVEEPELGHGARFIVELPLTP